MGSRNFKTIKGHRYLYFVRYDKGKMQTTYCGPAESTKAEKKYLELNLAEVRDRRAELDQKEAQIVRDIGRLTSGTKTGTGSDTRTQQKRGDSASVSSGKKKKQ